MLRLALLFLTAFLLGLPRALRGGAVIPRPASVYVDVEPGDPALTLFGAALEAELALEQYLPALRPASDTLIVEVHRAATMRPKDGDRRHAVSITLRSTEKIKRLILDYVQGNERAAARTLIASLPISRKQAN
jgi:hypothetical protein